MRIGISSARGGFTLVEVLIGSAIMAIAVVSIYAGIGQGFRVVSLAREQRRATQILLQTTETLRLYTWEQIHSNGFMPRSFTVPFSPAETNSVGTLYTVNLNVSDFPADIESYRTNLCQVHVTVNWTTDNLPRTREITTFVTRYGLQNCIYY